MSTDAQTRTAGMPLRIALVDPGDFTPAYDEELAGGLRRRGHEVVLIGRHGGPQSFAEVRRPTFYAFLASSQARALPAPVARGLKGVHHAVDMVRLPGLLRSMRPDVIHFQWTPLPLVDAAFLSVLRCIAPLVLTVHDSEPYQGAASRVMGLGFEGIVRRTDAVIAHTTRTAKRLLAVGVDPTRLHRVPHGLLHRQPLPQAECRPAADSRLRLLQFGKIKAYKGVDVLIEALGILEPALRHRVIVRVVGAPYVDPGPLLRRVAQLGVADTIKFRLGFVSDAEMMGCFTQADAMVFPYRQIDASGVLMAALAQGLPVIASRIGDFAELLQHGREALLVEPGDPPALADAIATLARSPARLKAMSRAMRQTRAAVPSWDEIAARTAMLYEGLRETRARCLTGPAARVEQRSGVLVP
jgi:glycosyltransferase involved in cell wall biosynthesis